MKSIILFAAAAGLLCFNASAAHAASFAYIANAIGASAAVIGTAANTVIATVSSALPQPQRIYF